MKKTILNSLTICTLFFATALNAQVGVGVPAENIHPSAELEVKSTTKGFLPPRMTNAERNSIATPATGLLIYQTDAVANNPAGLYFYDGTAWKNGLGVVGATGATGPAGAKGATGATGAVGQKGADGQGAFTIAGQGITVSGDGSEQSPYVISVASPCGLSIGQTYKGGIIFYLDHTGCHGLIAAPSDQSTSSQWFVPQAEFTNAYPKENSYLAGLFEGEYNSSNGPASTICSKLFIKVGGWYLPSIEELKIMHRNIGQRDVFSTETNEYYTENVGNLADEAYWSSTAVAGLDDFSLDAWAYSLQFGSFLSRKNNFHRVRAVRSF